MEIKNITSNSKIKIYAKINNSQISTSSNQKEYFSARLTDQNQDSISAKLWNLKDDVKPILKDGNICYIEADSQEYKGDLQLNISNIRLVTEDDNIDRSLFFERSHISLADLQSGIKDYINEIQNLIIKTLIIDIMKQYHEKFFTYPAAKTFHHAYISGLAEHTLGMLKLATSIQNLYPFANKDLLIAGVLLHDIEKTNEFESEYSPNYTKKGTLVGHIPMAVALLEQTATKLGISKDSEEVILLEHLILSHHGKPEWGSAKVPLVLEAELLHFIDLIDSRTFIINKSLNEVDNGEFTKKIFALDGRTFYKHKL